MRIQHNITAMNAYRNYNTNTKALAKNLEKLSSGYRINRAGDDAAGLAISEKMRAQITGLEVAQKNAKDGISLVQTAEGAMTEVHDMLNRMYELAEQSSNGTYQDAVDREQMQKEIQSLSEEIDRIADSTNFNGINLLDGSLSKEGGVAQTKSFDLPGVGDVLGTDTVLHKDAATGATKTSFSVTLNDNFSFSNETGKKMVLDIGGNSFILTGDGSGALNAKGVIDKFTTDFKQADGTTAAVDTSDDNKITINGAAFTVAASGSTLTFTQADDDTSIAIGDLPVTIGELAQVGTPGASGAGTTPGAGGGGATKTVTVTGGTPTGTAITPGADNKNGVEFDLSGLSVASADGATSATLNITLKDSTGALADKTVTVNWTDTTTDASLPGAIATALGATITPDKADGTGAATETVEVSESAGKITLKCGTAYAPVAGKCYDRLTVEVAAGSPRTAGTPAGRAAMSITTDEVSITKKTGAGAGGVDTYEFDVAGAGITGAGDVKLSIGGKDYTVTVADGDDDEAIAGKLAAAINADGPSDGKGKFTAAVDGAATSKIVLTASDTSLNGANKDLSTGKAKFAAVPANNNTDPAQTPGTGTPATVVAGSTVVKGDYTVGTTNIENKVDGGGARPASTHFELTKDMIKDGASIRIGDDIYTFKTSQNGNGSGNVVDVSNLDANSDTYLSDVATALTHAAKDNTTYEVQHNGTTGRVDLLERNADKMTSSYKGKLNTMEGIADSLAYTSASVKGGNGLVLQIGDTSDSFNKMSVSIKDMHAAAMGIGNIDVGSQEGASAAMKDIQKAINYVSDVRGDLGSLQNRLDHTISNLSVMQENIQDAEATIRDVDVAEEMMAYTKNNILVQSAQAMLAQANQLPQGVLQLLQ